MAKSEDPEEVKKLCPISIKFK